MSLSSSALRRVLLALRLRAWQVSGEGELIAWRHLWVGGSYARGDIREGRNRDSDYAGDDRTFEFSRSENGGDEGNITDVSLAAGYTWSLRAGRQRVILSAGYARSTRDLRIDDGVQVVADETILDIGLPEPGPFPGLESRYDARWKGPFAGLEWRADVGPRSSFFARGRYHWTDFDATAGWNLREDFAHPTSFTHAADGRGIALRGGWRRALTRRTALQFALEYRDFRADPGVDRVFFSDGEVAETRLNDANDRSVTFSVGLSGRR